MCEIRENAMQKKQFQQNMKDKVRVFEDGGIRLSGYYETDGADGPSRQRATALLGADGVLRELRAED